MRFVLLTEWSFIYAAILIKYKTNGWSFQIFNKFWNSCYLFYQSMSKHIKTQKL